jgi:peroxiredoxin
LNAAYGRIQEAGAIVYGVNPASDASHKSYAEKLKLSCPLIVDTGSRIARAYRSGWASLVRRTVYVVSPDGRIAFSKRGAPPVEELLDAISAWPGRT